MSDKNNTDPQDRGAELAADASLDLTIVRNDADAGGTACNTALAALSGVTGSVVIDFHIVSGSAVFADGTQTTSKSTNPLMMASVDFTDTAGEGGTISATVRSQPTLSKEADYSFQAAGGSSLDLLTAESGAAADGKSANAVQATLRDANGVPVANRMLTFTLAGGAATFRDGTRSMGIATDENGTVTADMLNASGADEKAAVTCAAADDAALTAEADVFFVSPAQAAASDKLTLRGPTSPTRSDGNDVAVVTARLTSASGTPVVGADLVFTLGRNSPAQFTDGKKTTIGTTNGNGEATALIVDGSQGHDFVTVSCSPAADPGIVTSTAVEFRASSESHSKLTLSPQRDNALADGEDQNLVKATLHDENKKGIAKEKIRFTIAEPTLAHFGDGKTVTTRVTGKDGTVTVPVIDNAQTDQTVSLTAFVISDPSLTDDIVLHFKAPAPGPTPTGDRLDLRPVTNDAPANGTDQNTVQASLLSPSGKPAPGETIVLNVPADGSARFTPGNTTVLAVVTDSTGKATAALVDDAGRNDTVTVSGQMARDPSVTAQTDLRFTAPGPKPSGNRLYLQPLKDNAAANGIDQNTVQAKLLDQSGNPLTGETLVLTVPASGTARFTPANTAVAAVVTDAAGKALAMLVDDAGRNDTVTVSGQMARDPSVTGQTDVHFLASAPKPSRQILLTAPKGEALGNGTDFASVQATLVDAADNPVAGENLVFSFAAGETATFQNGAKQRIVATGPQGRALVRIVDRIAVDKDVTVFCTLQSDPSVTNQIDVRFEEPVPVGPVPDMIIVEGSSNGNVENNGFRTVITQVTDKPGGVASSYIVRTRLYPVSPGTFYITGPEGRHPRQPTPDHSDTPIDTVPGKTVSVFNRVYFSGPQDMPATVQVRSELLRPGGTQVLEYTNMLPVVFPLPAPPTPPKDVYELIVPLGTQNPRNGLPGTATVMVKKNGQPYPNAELYCVLSDTDGCSYFNPTPAQLRSISTWTFNTCSARTDGNGQFTINLNRRVFGAAYVDTTFMGQTKRQGFYFEP